MTDAKADDFFGSTVGFRILLSTALFFGAGNGFVGLAQDTSDRYYSSDAKKDFALRDERTQALKESLISHIKYDAEQHGKHEEVMSKYREMIRQIENRLNVLERNH